MAQPTPAKVAVTGAGASVGRAMSPMVGLPRRAAVPAAVRRLSRLCLASAAMLLLCGPAAAQPTTPAEHAEITGNPQLEWQPADVTIAPGGTVTFRIVGATPHPVGSGSAPPNDDGRFDASRCGIDQLNGDGATCTVRFEKAGTYPYFCTLHFAAGMVGTITVGGGSAAPTTASATTATATTSAAAAPLVTAPPAVKPTATGRPAIYWAGYGLLAVGALLALVTVFAYVRFSPRFPRRRR
jgi:plastocyanin